MSKLNPQNKREKRSIGQTKEIKKSFIVYCEGQTESEYFKYFKIYKRITNLDIKIINLKKNGNALTLTKEAIRRKNNDKDNFDEFWIVIDKDETTHLDFEKAIELCNDNKILIAYSIQCFEVWILFHFQYLETKCDRNILEKKINDNLKKLKYGKSKKDLEKIFEEIFPKLEIAIQNAKKNHNKFEKTRTKISERESSSVVFQFIETILK